DGRHRRGGRGQRVDAARTPEAPDGAPERAARGAAHPARDRDRPPRRHGAAQRGSGPTPLDQRGDGEDAPEQHLPEARPPRPHRASPRQARGGGGGGRVGRRRGRGGRAAAAPPAGGGGGTGQRAQTGGRGGGGRPSGRRGGGGRGPARAASNENRFKLGSFL